MRFSKKIGIGTFAIVAIPLLSGAMNAASSQPQDPSTAELLHRIETLEAKVADLEHKAANPPQFNFQTQPFFNSAPGQNRSGALKVPANAIPRSFNGETFYVVPVTQQPAAAH